MTMYNATLELASKSELETDDRVDEIMDALEQYHPSLSASPRGWTMATISLPAESLAQAATTAIAVLTAATGVEVLTCEVMPTQEFDERNGFVPVPELLGTAEVAELLGVSAQRVRQLVEAGRLQAAPVGSRSLAFPRTAVEAFASRERPGGRPVKRA